MELLPSVKTQYSRIPPPHNRCCFVDSIRKSIVFNSPANSVSWNNSNFHHIKSRKWVISSSYDESGPIAQQGFENSPLSMELVPISSESHFDRVVAEAQQLEESVVILWMASWCRKCIYLKPKLEKLAADYYPRLASRLFMDDDFCNLLCYKVRFYSIDVNNVPHKLVVRAEVTKMPTIQLWRDGKKQAEVIGGHKAYLVVNEVREIIENENSL